MHIRVHTGIHSDTIVTYLPSLVLKVTLNGFKGFGLGAPSLPTSALQVRPRPFNEGFGVRGPRCSRFLLQHPQHLCSAFDFLFVAAAGAAAAGLQAGPYRPSPVQSTPVEFGRFVPRASRILCSHAHCRERGGAAVVAFVSKFACDVSNF